MSGRIETKAECEQALQRAEQLMAIDQPLGSAEAAELDRLVLAIEEYETQHYPPFAVHPIAALRFRLEQEGLL